MAVKLLVVDDRELVRAGVRCLVRGSEVQVVGESTCGEGSLVAVRQTGPDVVLMQMSAGADEPGSAAGQIKAERPQLSILAFSHGDDLHSARQALAIGANGFLTKSADRTELLRSIRAAASGERQWSREDLRRLTGRWGSSRLAGDSSVPLTPREQQVLDQLAAGLTNKEIAQALEISYETVKEHVQHILRKIGVVDRTQAAVWAVRQGWV